MWIDECKIYKKINATVNSRKEATKYNKRAGLRDIHFVILIIEFTDGYSKNTNEKFYSGKILKINI